MGEKEVLFTFNWWTRVLEANDIVGNSGGPTKISPTTPARILEPYEVEIFNDLAEKWAGIFDQKTLYLLQRYKSDQDWLVQLLEVSYLNPQSSSIRALGRPDNI